MDPRGPPLMGGGRWAPGDMYDLGSSSGDGGSNSMNTRLRFEEAGESSTGLRIGLQESGKGPESSRPPVRKPNQPPPKLVAARSFGGRRIQRQGPVPRQWAAMHGVVDGLNEAGSESMGIDGDGQFGMGLSTHLGLSEEIIVHPAHVAQSLSSSEFLGRTGRPATNTLDFLSGRSSMQTEYYGGRAEGFGGENVRIGLSGLPPIGNRQVQPNGGGVFSGGRNGMDQRPLDDGGSMAFNSVFMDRQEGARNAMDERRGENGAGSMMSNSLFMDRSDYRDDAQGGSSSFMGATESFVPSGGSMSQGMYDDTVGCGTDGRHYNAERHSLFGMTGGTSLENSSSSGSHGHVGSSSRSAACKRKSCTPVAPGNMSSRNGSPHRTGYRDSYSGRSGGSHGLSRRTVGGSNSAPETLASSSSPSESNFLGRYSEPLAGLEEPLSRRINYGREPAESSSDSSLREGRYGKSVAGSSSGVPNSQRTTRSAVLTNNSGINHSPPYPRTVRRVMPSHDNPPRRGLVPEIPMDADLVLSSSSSSSSSLLEQMLGGNQLQRSESPLLAGGRVGGLPRRSDAAFGSGSAGDRVMHRYLGSNSRGLLSSGSSTSPLGGSNSSESRVRSRVLNQHLEQMSQSPPSQPMSLIMQNALHAASPSTPSPSRPPPHPPTSLRGRLQSSTLHSLLPPPSPSGPAPSRLPPSPPVNPLSFAPSVDSLPPPSTLFRGSLLHGSSPARLRDQGFMSAAESFLGGIPFRGLQMSTGEEGAQPRLVAEILSALERVERDEDLTYEQLLMLEATLLFGGMGLHDQHSDLRLDVDNMSYEELLALEERIGNVSTGVTSEVMAQKLKKTRYSSLDAVVARYSQECDIKCSICQEEYEEGDEIGKIECGHGYHSHCIQQWLVQKNQCPICKAAALS